MNCLSSDLTDYSSLCLCRGIMHANGSEHPISRNIVHRDFRYCLAAKGRPDRISVMTIPFPVLLCQPSKRTCLTISSISATTHSTTICVSPILMLSKSSVNGKGLHAAHGEGFWGTSDIDRWKSGIDAIQCVRTKLRDSVNLHSNE
jgi:hypothetical protein